MDHVFGLPIKLAGLVLSVEVTGEWRHCSKGIRMGRNQILRGGSASVGPESMMKIKGAPATLEGCSREQPRGSEVQRDAVVEGPWPSFRAKNSMSTTFEKHQELRLSSMVVKAIAKKWVANCVFIFAHVDAFIMQTRFDLWWWDQEKCLADYGGGGSGISRGQITACMHCMPGTIYRGFSVSPFNRTIYKNAAAFLFTIGCFDSICYC